jgi:hypothetical protein
MESEEENLLRNLTLVERSMGEPINTKTQVKTGEDMF